MAFQNKRPGGYGVIGAHFCGEVDTFTCAHCAHIVFMNAARDLLPSVMKIKAESVDIGGFCRCCMKQICGPCCDEGGCVPSELRLQRIEQNAEKQRWYAEAVG